jgi:pectate lyase
MIECLDCLVFDEEYFKGQNLREKRTYKYLIQKPMNFTCIGKEANLMTKNGSFTTEEVGKVRIINVLHFQDSKTKGIHTLVKYEVIKLTKGR